MMPFLGYQEGFELGDPDKRKEQGLPEKPLAHPIDDMRARQNTYIAADSDWISFKASVCTAPDQIAIAPGYLEKEWEQDGRRCFAYSMGDTKILHFYSFLSARYERPARPAQGRRHRDLLPEGPRVQPGRMVDSIKKSLDYFQANFSPYQHRQVRILEFPRYASFAQSFPNTIPYSESIGFIARVRDDDPEDLDYPFYITAHEVAHQWWAHQVIGADVQGATMLSESLSQYAALMVMEDEFGPDKMKKFLAYELRGYLQGRGFERRRELSLMRNEGQGYIRYQKGSLVFYLLKDLLGEDVVNKALARLIREQAFKGPPFALADDLVDILREVTPPDLQYLITDLFEKITLYDNKASEPEVTAKDGKYHVRFKVNIRKLHAGDLGKEEAVPFDDYIDVGVFAAPGPSRLRARQAAVLRAPQVQVDRHRQARRRAGDRGRRRRAAVPRRHRPLQQAHRPRRHRRQHRGLLSRHGSFMPIGHSVGTNGGHATSGPRQPMNSRLFQSAHMPPSLTMCGAPVIGVQPWALHASSPRSSHCASPPHCLPSPSHGVKPGGKHPLGRR
jgi:ABC-2 type transport system permease protein